MAPQALAHQLSTTISTTDGLEVVTVTPVEGTTTIYITSPIPTSSKPPSHHSKTNDTAIIAGSVAGGFVGCCIVLGGFIWFFCFRNGSQRRSTDGVLAGGAATRGKGKSEPATTAMTVMSSSGSQAGLAAEKTHGEGDDNDDLERPALQPLQPPASQDSSGGSSSTPLAPGAAVRARPMTHRTITSTSIDSAEGHVVARRIPVVTPSFAYRDSVASNSSGSGSGRKIAALLKRGTGGGSGASGSGAGSGSGSGSGDSKGKGTYQYGVVGSAESRRGSLLALAPPSNTDLARGEFGEMAGVAGPFLDSSTSGHGRRPSSPTVVTGSRLRQAYQPSDISAPIPMTSRPNTGRQSSGSGSSNLHRGETSSSNSHHQSRQGRPSELATSTVPERPDRSHSTSPSHAEHIAFSNYFTPRPTIHRRPSAGRTNSAERRRSHHSATASDEGHVATTVSDPLPNSQPPHRSLSLGAVNPRGYPPAPPPIAEPPEAGPSTLGLAGPESVPPRRSPAPPSAFVYGGMTFTPERGAAPTTEQDDLLVTKRRKNRSRSGTGHSSRAPDASGDLAVDVDGQPSRRRPLSAGDSVPASPTNPMYPSDGTGTSGDTDADADLRRLAREARRAERRIRRGNRGGAPGENTSESDRDRERDPSGSGRRHHRGHHSSSRRRRESRPGTGDSAATDNSSSGGQGRKLVLMNG